MTTRGEQWEQRPKISSVWLTSTKPLSAPVVAAQRSIMAELTSTAAAQERQTR